MTEKRQLSDMRAQAVLDDARLDARKQQIMGHSGVTTRRKAGATSHANPSWLTADPPPAPVAAAPKKQKRSSRRTTAKPVISPEEKWNRAMDEASSHESDE